jgi:hypothetical protein
VLYWPAGAGGRWYLSGLWNWVEADAPVLSLRLGEQDVPPGFLSRYHTGAVGLNYVLRRNVRLLGETMRDFEQKQTRFIAGFTLAF